MSKKPPDLRDWRSASEALLRASRTDHAPSEVDRARVRSGLARRLADSGVQGADAPLATAGGGTALGKAVMIVAAVCVTVGSFMYLHTRDDAQDATRPAPAPVVANPTPQPPKPPAPAAPSPSEPPNLSTERTEREPIRRAVVAPTREQTKSGNAPAAARSPSAPDARPATTPSIASASASADTGGETDAPARIPEAQEASNGQSEGSREAAPTAARTRASNSPARDGDPSDARGELEWLTRINAAMAQAKHQVVLNLCAEHKRRWSEGTFVEEREALRAIASCKTGAAGGSDIAAAFLARYPRGPLAPRVRDACTAQPARRNAGGAF